MRTIIVLAAFIAAALGAPGCPCILLHKPVCGNDGVEYGNKCMMECQGVTLKHEGKCTDNARRKREADVAGSKCACPDQIGMPVCGKDGVTYNSMCAIGCAGAQFRFLGNCPATPAPATTEATTEAEPVVCTEDYTPVCGDDGVTYSNLCNLEATDGVTLASEGECTDDNRKKREADVAGSKCECPDQIGMPVCGKDGITYNSMCAIGCAGTQFRFLGNCPATPAPATTEATTEAEPVVCTNDYTPVCGDDGVTYSNMCDLESADGVTMASEGECPDDNRRKREADVAGTKCDCPDQIDMPVCGKDGITYNSMCAIGCAGVKFRFLGHCPPSTEAPVTTEAPTTTEAVATTTEAPAPAGGSIDILVIPCLSDDCTDDD